MRDLRTPLLAVCTALLCAIFVPCARASDHPTSRAVGLIASAYVQVPSMPNDAAPNTTNTPDQSDQANISPDQSQQPVSNDQSQATQPQAVPSAAQSQATQPQATQGTSPDEANKELPKTASPTPLIGLIGMLSLTVAFGLRQFAKRLS